MGFFTKKEKQILMNLENKRYLALSKKLSKEEQKEIALAKHKLSKYKLKLTQNLSKLSGTMGLSRMNFLKLCKNRSLAQSLALFKLFKQALISMHVPFMPPLTMKLSYAERRLWFMIYRRKLFLRDMELERQRKIQLGLQKNKLDEFKDAAFEKYPHFNGLELKIDASSKKDTTNDEINNMRAKFKNMKDVLLYKQNIYSKSSNNNDHLKSKAFEPNMVAGLQKERGELRKEYDS